jgi:RIO-like serine/threonine protein kinase
LELFDHRIGHQDFDARHERAILKRGHSNGVNVPEVVRLYRSDVIAKATGDCEAKDCRK